VPRPSRRFRLTSTLALAAALVGGGLAALPSSAANAPYRTKDAFVTVHDGPDGKHTAVVDTRLYVPRDVDAQHPAPAILMTHGFGLSKTGTEVTATADFLASHGYVVLTWTAQGFGASSGCIQLDSYAYDVKDVEQLIAKVLQPRHDILRDSKGLVLGMTGGSYGGGITLNVASVDHRIRAIVAGRTWNDLAYSLDPNNYVVPGDPTGFTHSRNVQGVFKKEWTSLFFASGNSTPIGGLPPNGQEQGSCPQEKAGSGDAATTASLPCLGYPMSVCQTYADIAATGDANASDRALVDASSVSTHINSLNAATLLLQGQADTLFNLNDALATYTALKRRHVPVAMTWNSGGHGGYNSLPGECDVFGGGDTGLDDCYLTGRTLGWFDHYLRGAPLHNFPGFTYHRDWVPFHGHGTDAVQYAAAPAYPAQHKLTFTLSGSVLLAPPGQRAVSAGASFLNPPGGEPASYSETSNFSAPGSTPDLSGQQPSDPPGEAVLFTSPAFVRPVVSVGVPSATLRLSHVNGQDLVFFGKVFDVAPDGSATLIKRLIAPVRVPAAATDKPVHIQLLGFVHRFAKGHSVRLVLAATDQSSYNSPVPDQITVKTGRGSTFSLPVDSPRGLFRNAS
jgi:ABC-2 type transport system ATP-binding protein